MSFVEVGSLSHFQEFQFQPNKPQASTGESQMKGYTLFSRAEKYFDKILKYSSPEKLGYFLPNFAQYILWVKGIKIYTYAEPRTICKEKYKS